MAVIHIDGGDDEKHTIHAQSASIRDSKNYYYYYYSHFINISYINLSGSHGSIMLSSLIIATTSSKNIMQAQLFTFVFPFTLYALLSLIATLYK